MDGFEVLIRASEHQRDTYEKMDQFKNNFAQSMPAEIKNKVSADSNNKNSSLFMPSYVCDEQLHAYRRSERSMSLLDALAEEACRQTPLHKQFMNQYTLSDYRPIYSYVSNDSKGIAMNRSNAKRARSMSESVVIAHSNFNELLSPVAYNHLQNLNDEDADADDDDAMDSDEENNQDDPQSRTITLPHMIEGLSNLYNKNGGIGIYTKEERANIILKFRQKRLNRVWKKKTRYPCRKNLADRRVRVKGRFVKASDMNNGSNLMNPAQIMMGNDKLSGNNSSNLAFLQSLKGGKPLGNTSYKTVPPAANPGNFRQFLNPSDHSIGQEGVGLPHYNIVMGNELHPTSLQDAATHKIIKPSSSLQKSNEVLRSTPWMDESFKQPEKITILPIGSKSENVALVNHTEEIPRQNTQETNKYSLDETAGRRNSIGTVCTTVESDSSSNDDGSERVPHPTTPQKQIGTKPINPHLSHTMPIVHDNNQSDLDVSKKIRRHSIAY